MVQFGSRIVFDGPAYRPKRQRLAFTCEACRKRKIKCDKAKPKCFTCARLGKQCVYETQSWNNTHVESYKSSNKEEDNKTKSRAQLLKEVEYWRSKAEDGTQKDDVSKFSIDQPLELHGSDILDFHEPHNATYIQETNHEHALPLNSMSIHKNNHYMELFLCPKFLVRYLVKNKIDSSLSDLDKWTLLFGTAPNDLKAKSNLKALIEDREDLQNGSSLSAATSANYSISAFNAQEAESILPDKCSFYMLLDHFFNDMWALRPVVDKELFLDDLQRIVKFNDDGENAKLTLKNQTDLNTLAILLIILRYTYASLAKVDEVDLSSNLLRLKQRTHIPVKSISISYLCLSRLNPGQKRSLQLLQGLLLLVFYFKDRPEECICSSSAQYYTILGLVKDSALAIGLHKDPIYYGIPTETHLANLRRRLWFTIASLDTESQVLGGCLGTLPTPSTINVNFPATSFNSPLEQAEIDELRKNYKLQNILNSLCEHINHLEKKPTLSTLLYYLDEASSYIKEHYSINRLSDLTNFEVDSQLYKATAYKNEKILEKQITISSVKITTYQLILSHYEDNRFANLEVFRHLHHKYIQEIFHSLDITGGLLSNSFRSFMDPLKSSFAIYPFITLLVYKLLNAIQAILLRIFHAQDLLICHLYQSGSNVNRYYYETLIAILFNILDNYIGIMKNAVGSKTYSGLKLVCSANINLHLLKAHRFNSMTKFCNYYDTTDHDDLNVEEFWDEPNKDIDSESGNSVIEQGLFSAHTQWLRMSSSYRAAVYNTLDAEQQEHFRFCNSVVNVGNINQFAEFSTDEIDKMTEIFTQKPKYYSGLTSENLYIRDNSKETELWSILNEAMTAFDSQSSVETLMKKLLKEANDPNGSKLDITAEHLDSLDFFFDESSVTNICK